MRIKAFCIGILLSMTLSIAVYGALPSKPDFAFPKTVNKNAEKQLKAAMKRNDGPATVRALLDLGLARTEIDPDQFESTMRYFSEVAAEVKDPATRAMIQLARASAENNGTLLQATVSEYADILRKTKTFPWRNVVIANETFFPTLYDFAVATTSDTHSAMVDEAIAYDSVRPLPLVYLLLRRENDFKQRLKLYHKFKDTDAAIYTLLGLTERAWDLDERKQVYPLLVENRELSSEIKGAIDYIVRPNINIDANNVVALNSPLEVKINATCLNRAKLRVAMKNPRQTVVKVIDLNFKGQGVFQADTTVVLQFNEFGIYELTPEFDGMTTRFPGRLTVHVTDFLLSRPVFGNKRLPATALNAINGKVLDDVTIRTEGNRINGRRGKDIYSPSLHFYANNGDPAKHPERLHANVLTDRAIYHPGDTLRFAATLMSVNGTARALASGRNASVILRNANYQPVDTLNLISDDFGRITGEFKLPADGLTGHFTLGIDNYGYASVMVSDYKAPTFIPELKATRIDSVTVELTGSAIGLNGFPLADASVALEIDKLPIWVWYRTFPQFRSAETIATDTVMADASGRFSARITIPAGMNLRAAAAVTSPTGETRTADAFIPFYRYHIEGQAASCIEAGKAPVFTVIDADGNRADVELQTELISTTDSTVTVPDKDWTNVPSGAYTLRVSAHEAADLTFETTVYRQSDAMPPVTSALFVPVTEVAPGSRLMVGTSFADSNILLTVWTPDSILQQRRLTPEQGNFFIDVTLPEGVDDATMTLLTLRNYRFTTHNIRISRPDALRNLKIEITSLRDHMVPGQSETWTLRVTDNLGTPARAAMMVDVYSKALDALQPFSWHFDTPGISGSYLHFNNAPSYSSGASNSSRIARIDNPADTYPRFNLYDRMWQSTGEKVFYSLTSTMPANAKFRVRGVRSMAKEAKMADSGASNGNIMYDEAAADTAVEDEMAETESYAAGTGYSEPKAESYRMPEMAVALWKPVLTTTANGALEIKFTAPDANTTWAVNVLAYDNRLLSGTASARIVTSKPVMVQPQIPRFMRNGDHIELRALVMNNTAAASAASAFIEIFNPTTNDVISRRDFTLDLGANSSETITLGFTAPDNTATVGVRVRATAGNFTDGEQSLIPILPDMVNVHTGQPLFIAADSTEFSVKVPRGAIMTFTPNAVWECVTALPGLQASESKSALSAASALFSAATARGLLRTHPEIGKALSRASKGDSLFLSRLMRNDDLKIALLESTPFVNAAAGESERKARLHLIFNNAEIDKTLTDAETTLGKLVRNDGGLAWTGNSDESSEWITLRVMQTLGQLKRMGYLPKSSRLNRIITGAIEYLDRKVARTYAENKKATFEAYVMMRSQFPEIRISAPARRAADATVQHIVGHWRDLPVGPLADAAIILFENHYQATARTLIESLRQREAWNRKTIDPTLLNAFAMIEPQSPEVNIIRSEYIARKQSMDWGAGPECSDLIAAILNSGTSWLVPAPNELTVKVNGHAVDPGSGSLTGEFRLSLPEGGTVEIAKGRYPAWGGIFTSLTDSISAISAFASDKVKISRTVSGNFAVGSKVTMKLTIEAAQTMDYVVVTQPRCAGLEVADQLPSAMWLGNTSAYREPCATVTNWFFNRLPAGKTEIVENFYVTATGSFALAPAEVQSQYAPEFQAHTAGRDIKTGSQTSK